jgi:hypothetical protein
MNRHRFRPSREWPLHRVFQKLVLEEDDDEKALERLGLFEGVELGGKEIECRFCSGSLERLLKVSSWLLERGHVLDMGWATEAAILGADPQTLKGFIEGLAPEDLDREVCWIWKRGTEKARSRLRTDTLAWLSRETGLVGGEALGSPETLRDYLEAGGDPNARVALAEAKGTLLHYVKDARMARMLLEAGADPNARNVRKRTPLHEIIPRWEVAEVLLAFGANPVARDWRGDTPVDVAEKSIARPRSYLEFARRLSEHPAYKRGLMLEQLKEL